jgi:hypothetical protein
VIELFTVPPDEDEAFRAAWAAQARPGETLHRALRSGVQPRFASLADAPAGGVLLVAPDPRGWEAACAHFAGRRGFLGARMLADRDGRPVGVAHWSSPLMYARAVREHGALPHAALYGSAE